MQQAIAPQILSYNFFFGSIKVPVLSIAILLHFILPCNVKLELHLLFFLLVDFPVGQAAKI